MQQYSCATVTSQEFLRENVIFICPKPRKMLILFLRPLCLQLMDGLYLNTTARRRSIMPALMHHCTFIIKSCFSTFIFLAYLNFLPLQKKKANFSTYYAERGSRVVSKLGCSNCQSACGCRPALSPGPLHFSPLLLSVENMFIKAHGA